MFENSYYDRYMKFTKEIDKNKFCRGVDLVDYNERETYRKLNLYTYTKKDGYTYVKISREQFNELLYKITGKRYVYVFDQKNKLIGGGYNMNALGRKYGSNHTTIKNRLKSPHLKSDNYYYSYDKDFKIDVKKQPRKPINDLSSTKYKEAIEKRNNKYKNKYNEMVKDLMNDHKLLTKPLEEIANDYGYTRRGLHNLFTRNEIFKDVFELRKKLIAKADEEYKFKQSKVSKNKIKEGFVSNIEHKDSVRDTKILVNELKLDNNNIKRVGKLGFKGLRDKLAYLRKDKYLSKNKNEIKPKQTNEQRILESKKLQELNKMNTQELRALIKKSGRSQKWIAAELNIPYLTLSSYMNGYKTMPERVEQKIKEII